MMSSEPVSSSTPAIPTPTPPGTSPDAVNVHDIFTYLATSTPEGMAELKAKFADAFGAAGLSGKETAVIYEQSMNTGFGQSCRGYFLLTMLGYPKVKVLHGGYDAWTAAGMPIDDGGADAGADVLPDRSRGRRHPDRRQDHAGRARQPEHRQARRARRRRVDRRQLLALRQGLLPAQGPHPRRGLARMVPHDEADRRRPALQVAGARSSPNARPSASRRRRRSISTASRARAPPTPSSRSRRPA